MTLACWIAAEELKGIVSYPISLARTALEGPNGMLPDTDPEAEAFDRRGSVGVMEDGAGVFVIVSWTIAKYKFEADGRFASIGRGACGLA